MITIRIAWQFFPLLFALLGILLLCFPKRDFIKGIYNVLLALVCFALAAAVVLGHAL